MKIKLTYFKPSGKYYTSGEYESAWNSDYLWKITEEVRIMYIEKKLPGLVEGFGTEFSVLIEPNEEDAVPALIHPSQFVRELHVTTR